MSDFMKWLYAHYISPYLDTAPRGDYEFWLSLPDSEVAPMGREAAGKAVEFHAVHSLPPGPSHRGGTGLPHPGGAGGHSPMNGCTCPNTRGLHTAATSMVSP